jgi:hypothetical protein
VSDIVMTVSCPTCNAQGGTACLDADAGYVHPARAKAYKAYLKTTKTEDQLTEGAYLVDCPTCKRPKGSRCRSPKGVIQPPHVRRRIAAGLATPILLQPSLVHCTACQKEVQPILETVTHSLRHVLGQGPEGPHKVTYLAGPLVAIGTQDDKLKLKCPLCSAVLMTWFVGAPSGFSVVVANDEDELAGWQVVQPPKVEDL